MSEENTGAQAATGSETGAETAQTGGNAAGQDSGATMTLEQAQAIIRELRSENASRRKTAAELEAKVKEHESSRLSDQEKLQKSATEAAQKAQDAETRLKALSVQMAVERAARKLGIVDEDAAVKLLDPGTIEFDGDTPKNIEALLGELVKVRPWLKGVGEGNNGASTANPGQQGRKLTKDQIRNMTPDQINANWDAVKAALAG